MAFEGQIVNFFFFKRASLSLDIVLKQEGIVKSFPIDINIVPHFEVVSFGMDMAIREQKTKTFPIDAILKAERELSFGLDMVLYQPYVPPPDLVTEQKKTSYTPYVKIVEIE